MKLETAIKTLIKEVEFLGFKNLGDLVKDMELNPMAYNQSATQALKIYLSEAYK